jgi:hypothetical protein
MPYLCVGKKGAAMVRVLMQRLAKQQLRRPPFVAFQQRFSVSY